MFLAGVGIPVLAALNGGLGTRLGSPMAAFCHPLRNRAAQGTCRCRGDGIARRRSAVGDCAAAIYFGGFFVVFYVIAVTFITPRFGAFRPGNADPADAHGQRIAGVL
ncbi:DMT family transporter [Sphingopyxis flava]|uniref:Putative inner membrane exporter, YdcZ n=1 Tax=Sphingopyxis flava TaxID=1507287 RepID=A0A1T5EYQ8_9SPHN|nr:DMT family transporter [Sphingopyxis flava]SKB89104.1 Putative inner membrane exporter, YdcZ [Sphingopyxis flava]